MDTYVSLILVLILGGTLGIGCLYLLGNVNVCAMKWTHGILFTLGGIIYSGICTLHASSIGLAICSILFGTVLTVGAFIDKQYLILPDEGAMILMVCGMLRWLWIPPNWYVMVGQCCLVAVVMYGLRYISHDGLGLGDVKWITVLSLWFSPEGLWVMLVLTFGSGAFGGILLRLRRGKQHMYMPLGPFIAGSSIVSFFWEEVLRGWYWQGLYL